MPSTLTGGCLCGAVRYTVAAPVTGLRACHCINCQKSSGTERAPVGAHRSGDRMPSRQHATPAAQGQSAPTSGALTLDFS